MHSSLRGRLLFFYTAMLAVVVAAFGTFACYLAWRSRIAEIDEGLHARARELAASLRPAAAGTFDLALPPPPEAGRGATYHLVLAPDGSTIDQSDPEIAIPPLEPPAVRTHDRRREVAIRAASGSTVLTGRPLDALYDEIGTLATAIGMLGAAALALTLAGGQWLVRRALRPIDRISDTARTMVDGNFAARIPEDRVETELGQLVRALNGAFDRLHGSLERQRRFTADASHELRTPLATISTETQWALARARAPAEYRRSLEVSGRAVARMLAIVERLLALARAEAGADAWRTLPVRLDDLARTVAEDLRPLAAAGGIDLRVQAAPLAVTGDPDRLRDALTNVVANAIQYTPSGGAVHIAARETDGRPTLQVTDTGMGIAPDDVPRVFDPFFRGDRARQREAAGAGLGLAVTRAILRQHGGEARCTSTPGTGTSIVLEFPAAAPPDADRAMPPADPDGALGSTRPGYPPSGSAAASTPR